MEGDREATLTGLSGAEAGQAPGAPIPEVLQLPTANLELVHSVGQQVLQQQPA